MFTEALLTFGMLKLTSRMMGERIVKGIGFVDEIPSDEGCQDDGEFDPWWLLSSPKVRWENQFAQGVTRGGSEKLAENLKEIRTVYSQVMKG